MRSLRHGFAGNSHAHRVCKHLSTARQWRIPANCARRWSWSCCRRHWVHRGRLRCVPLPKNNSILVLWCRSTSPTVGGPNGGANAAEKNLCGMVHGLCYPPNGTQWTRWWGRIDGPPTIDSGPPPRECPGFCDVGKWRGRGYGLSRWHRHPRA